MFIERLIDRCFHVIDDIHEMFYIRPLYIYWNVQRSATLHRIGAEWPFLWMCAGYQLMSPGQSIHPARMFNRRIMVDMFCVGSIVNVHYFCNCKCVWAYTWSNNYGFRLQLSWCKKLMQPEIIINKLNVIWGYQIFSISVLMSEHAKWSKY